MNLQYIADSLGFELEDVVMLMDMFLENAKQSLEDLNKAIDTGDHAGIKNASHAIKGSSANLMLEDITSIASDIEELAKKESDANYLELSNILKQRISTLEEIKEPIC
jgi:HPt (histidine-containing phosphotransfer) domain-containing protein